ncbi:hypothetical protein JHW43_002841 [Diplocarpon mali]|nr:hypothetical protein JHW43_002841 [Diplocarpon mali]
MAKSKPHPLVTLCFALNPVCWIGLIVWLAYGSKSGRPAALEDAQGFRCMSRLPPRLQLQLQLQLSSPAFENHGKSTSRTVMGSQDTIRLCFLEVVWALLGTTRFSVFGRMGVSDVRTLTVSRAASAASSISKQPLDRRSTPHHIVRAARWRKTPLTALPVYKMRVAAYRTRYTRRRPSLHGRALRRLRELRDSD